MHQSGKVQCMTLERPNTMLLRPRIEGRSNRTGASERAVALQSCKFLRNAFHMLLFLYGALYLVLRFRIHPNMLQRATGSKGCKSLSLALLHSPLVSRSSRLALLRNSLLTSHNATWLRIYTTKCRVKNAEMPSISGGQDVLRNLFQATSTCCFPGSILSIVTYPSASL